MPQQNNAGPRLQWDGKMLSVALPLERGGTVEAKWQPGLTWVVRIREAGTDTWSFGFETPVPGCTFVDLKPDTEYEVLVREKTANQLEAAGFALEVKAESACAARTVMVDADFFTQIVINLIDNAVKFAGAQEPMRIELGTKDPSESESFASTSITMSLPAMPEAWSFWATGKLSIFCRAKSTPTTFRDRASIR